MDRESTAADRVFMLMLKTVVEDLFGAERSREYFPLISLFLHLIKRNAFKDGRVISMEQAYQVMALQPNLVSHFRLPN